MLKCLMQKLRTFRLSHPSQVTMDAMLKVHADDLQNMDADEHDALAEKRHGHKLRWPKNARVNCLPVGRSIEEVDAALAQITDRGIDR